MKRILGLQSMYMMLGDDLESTTSHELAPALHMPEMSWQWTVSVSQIV